MSATLSVAGNRLFSRDSWTGVEGAPYRGTFITDEDWSECRSEVEGTLAVLDARAKAREATQGSRVLAIAITALLQTFGQEIWDEIRQWGPDQIVECYLTL